MKFKEKLLSFLKTVFPENLTELLIFAAFLMVYGIPGSFIALNYTIVFDNRIPWDAYFSFDNRSVVLNGGGVERHPFSKFFFDPVREFAFLFSGGQRNEIFRLVLVWVSNFAISLGIVQVYKYLNNIIGLPGKISFLLIIFYGLFSTNILLSFTPENYTFTLLLLALFNYYSALKLRAEKKIPGSALALGAVTIGGFTVTNVVKVFIPVFFEKEFFRNRKPFLQGIARMLFAAAVFIVLVLWRIDFNIMRFLTKSGSELEKFSSNATKPYWDMIASWFVGGNVLLAGFELRDYKNVKGFEYKAIFMDVYTAAFPYFFVTVFLALLFWGYFKNFRNTWVQILFVSFFIDVAIHCILKFGLVTGYIYGGHFVFVYPLIFGWLFQAYRNSPKVLTFLYAVFAALFLYLGLNNFLRMEEFLRFLDEFYR